MKKEVLAITIKDGMIQHIGSTTEDIDILIIDHDNFENDEERAMEEIDNVYEPDQIMTVQEISDMISSVKKEHESVNE